MLANPRTFWATTNGQDVFHDVKMDEKFDDGESFSDADADAELGSGDGAPQEFMKLGAEGVQWSYRPSPDLIDNASSSLEHDHPTSSSAPSAPQRPTITLPPLSMRLRNEYMAQRTQDGMIVEQQPHHHHSSETPGGMGARLYSPYRTVQQESKEKRVSVPEDVIISPSSSNSTTSPLAYVSATEEDPHASLLARTPSVGAPAAVALPAYRPRRYR